MLPRSRRRVQPLDHAPVSDVDVTVDSDRSYSSLPAVSARLESAPVSNARSASRF
jgi:hypothetical protein